MLKLINKLGWIFSIALVLSGCASYFERSAQNHCFRSDWLTQGFDAGKRGKALQTQWQRANARCEKYNFWSNRADFEHGYELGKKAFCDIDNGFEFGLRDKAYTPICEPSLQSEFDRAYADGRQLYQARRDVDHYEAELNEALYFIDYAYDRRQELAEKIDSGELDEHTKKKYIKERYKLKKRRERTRYGLPQCRDRLRDAERRAHHLALQLSDYYDVDGVQTAENYSINQTIESENRVVTEPAVIVYAPKKPTHLSAKTLRQQVQALTEHVSLNVDRRFRYQVLREGVLSFVNAQGEENTVDLLQRYQLQPSLLFWNPQAGLTVQRLTGSDAHISEISEFIAAHRKKNLMTPSTRQQYQPSVELTTASSD